MSALKRKPKKVEPSNRPQKIRGGKEEAWFYESRRGVEIYVSVPGLNAASVARIPWWKLMASATRCGWKVQKISGGTP